MRYIVNQREFIKVPAFFARLQWNGTTLEMTRESSKSYNYQTVDTAKYDLVTHGMDDEGYMVLEIIPRDAEIPSEPTFAEKSTTATATAKQPVEFDPSRKRIHGYVVIPPEFSPYLEYETTHGSKYKVYVNDKKHFLIEVETKDGARLHNLGVLGEPKGWLTRFLRHFENWNEWLSREQIKSRLHAERMYDGQKLTMGLLILQREGLIKMKDGVYAISTLEVDTGVYAQSAIRREKQEQQAMADSLESEA